VHSELVLGKLPRGAKEPPAVAAEGVPVLLPPPVPRHVIVVAFH
jgi:hypothetical protein